MRRRYLTAAAAVAAVVAVAGCSSGSSDSSGSSSNGGGSSSSNGAAPAGSLKLGLANMDTGTTSFPAVQQGAQAAVKYVNAHGGIGGKQVSLVSCDMKNDNQAAQECGQQFANDKSMPFAFLGLTLNGGPYYSAMSAANKATLGAIGITPADNGPADAFFYYPGATYYTYIADYVKNSGAKKVSYIYEDEAASIAGYQTVSSALKGSDVSIKGVEIPTTASDLTPQVQSADIGSADMMLVFSTGVCPKLTSAMKSLGVKPKKALVVNTCLTPQNVQQSPSDYEGWLLASPSKMPVIGKGEDADVDQFLDGWDQYGPGGTPGTFAELGWGVVLTAQKVFAGESNITADTAMSKIKSFTGPVIMGTKSISCPGPAPYTATCAKGLLYYKISNGKYTPANVQ
jgi:ABC-type branched-subunit amino acid transport system substrate-binding protein